MLLPPTDRVSVRRCENETTTGWTRRFSTRSTLPYHHVWSVSFFSRRRSLQKLRAIVANASRIRNGHKRVAPKVGKRLFTLVCVPNNALIYSIPLGLVDWILGSNVGEIARLTQVQVHLTQTQVQCTIVHGPLGDGGPSLMYNIIKILYQYVFPILNRSTISKN